MRLLLGRRVPPAKAPAAPAEAAPEDPCAVVFAALLQELRDVRRALQLLLVVTAATHGPQALQAVSAFAGVG